MKILATSFRIEAELLKKLKFKLLENSQKMNPLIIKFIESYVHGDTKNQAEDEAK
jgi:hypothetical protein